MIKITDKKKCCGCGGCAQACPHHCIKMVEDEEGFLYPKVDETLCVDCGLCDKVCPCLNELNLQPSLKKTFALKEHDASRIKSSSGGAFASMARYVISRGGLVYGVALNAQKDVVHICIEKECYIDKLRGSKYAQSDLGNTYTDIKKQLKDGRLVLFSGVSCQVKGLRAFLKKDFDNLLTAEILCHGVSSPGIYKKYLDEVCEEYNINIDGMENVFFRNPKIWKEFILSIGLKDGRILQGPCNNSFMKGFSSNLIVRPSCFDCQAKCLKAGSDVLLGDFWCLEYVDSEFVDNKGVSLVIANTEKGLKLVNSIESEVKEFKYETALLGNRNIEHSQKWPGKRNEFFSALKENNNYTSTIIEYTQVRLTIVQKIRHYVASVFKVLGLSRFVEYIRDRIQRRLYFSGKLD